MLVVALSGISVLAQTNATRLPDAPSVCKPVLLNQYLSASLNSQNRRALPNSPAYVPLTGTQKFQIFVDSLKSPLTFMSAGIGASVQYAVGTRMYGDGLGGFGKRYGATLANTEGRSFFNSFLFPVLFHQDPRYHPSQKAGILPRAWYASTRVVVGRSDEGNKMFNYSEVLGVLAMSSIQNSYYPNEQRGFTDTLNRFLGGISSDASGNLLKEFTPDIKRIARKIIPKRAQKLEKKIPGPVRRIGGPLMH